LLLLVLASQAAALFANGDRIARTVGDKLSRLARPEATATTRGMEFVRARVAPGEEFVALSRLSGVWHQAARGASALRLPGLIEMHYRKDFDALLDFLRARTGTKVFLQTADPFYLLPEINRELIETVLDNYRVAERGPEGDLLLLAPRRETFGKAGPLRAPLLPREPRALCHYLVAEDFAICDERGSFVSFLPETRRPVRFGSAFTIEAVVRPEAGQPPYGHILGNHPGQGHQGFAIQMERAGADSYTFIYGDGRAFRSTSGFRLAPGAWHYLAIGADGRRIRVFVDGEPAVEADMAGPIENSPSGLALGDWQNRGRRFAGQVREARLLPFARSAQDIRGAWEAFARLRQD